MNLFITNHTNNYITKIYQYFSFLSCIELFNAVMDILNITRVSNKSLQILKVFKNNFFTFCSWDTGILFLMDPQHTKRSNQYLVGSLSYWVFPDPGTLTFGILYGWSGIRGQFRLCCCLFSFVTSSKLIIIFNFSFLHILSIVLLHTLPASVNIWIWYYSIVRL